MPEYNASAISVDKPVLTAGRPIVVWDGTASPAEGVTNGDCSMQVSLHRHPNFPNCLSAQIEFSADPGAYQVDLQTADVDEDKYYVTKASMKTAGDLNASFVGRIEATNVVAKFARLKMVTLTNAVTVSATLF